MTTVYHMSVVAYFTVRGNMFYDSLMLLTEILHIAYCRIKHANIFTLKTCTFILLQ